MNPAPSQEIRTTRHDSPRAIPQPWCEFWMVGPLLLVPLLLFLRLPRLFVHPQLWAEDAAVLFTGARADGWHTLFLPYPTYYIFAQRLIACVAARLPAIAAPWVYSYSALAYMVLTAWFCLRARLDHLMGRDGKITLALALVLVPHNGEVFMKLIGTQWVLMAILVLLIVQEAPTDRRQVVADFSGLLLAGATGPYIVLFAPFFLLRLRRAAGGRSHYNLSLFGAAWCLAGVQFVTMMLRPGLPNLPFTHEAAQWVRQLGFILPGRLFFGAIVPRYLGPAFYVISPLLLALLGWALWQGERKRLWASLALLGCGGIAYFGGLKTLAVGVVVLEPFGDGGRYFYPLYLFSMWIAVIYCHDPAKHLRVAARLALIMMLASGASDFNCKYMKWPDRHWERYTQRLDAGEAVTGVPILPGWTWDFPARK